MSWSDWANPPVVGLMRARRAPAPATGFRYEPAPATGIRYEPAPSKRLEQLPPIAGCVCPMCGDKRARGLQDVVFQPTVDGPYALGSPGPEPTAETDGGR
jgi:hypothetical protein